MFFSALRVCGGLWWACLPCNILDSSARSPETEMLGHWGSQISSGVTVWKTDHSYQMDTLRNSRAFLLGTQIFLVQPDCPKKPKPSPILIATLVSILVLLVIALPLAIAQSLTFLPLALTNPACSAAHLTI